MFLPIGDTPNPRNYVPWVNWMLIGANVLVYAIITLPLSQQLADPSDPNFRDYVAFIKEFVPAWATVADIVRSTSAYDVIVFAHGYKPGAPELSDLFTSLFMHGGFLHLAGNMLFLWIYGDNVEHRLGRLGYLFTYLFTGVVATLAFALVAGNSMTPLVGASGAISGVLGLYFFLFPRNQVKVFVLLFPIFFNVVLIPARWVLGIYLVWDNLLPFFVGAESNVAYGAHIGGFVGGLAVAWVGDRLQWRLPTTSNRPREFVGKDGTSSPQHPRGKDGRALLRAAVERGDSQGALQTFFSLSRGEVASLPPDDCVYLAGWLADRGHGAAGSSLLRRCISTHQSSSEMARVYLMLGLLTLAEGQATAAYQHLQSVFDHDPDPDTAARARAALGQIDIFKRR